MELEFEFFKPWVKENLMIDLDAYKEKQLYRRIGSVMKSAGAKNLRDYAIKIRNDENVRKVFLDYITINVTEFYRNKEIFDEFEGVINEVLIPKFNQIKIWSAACSLGAEPYSIALIMEKNQFRNSKILATDIDENILEKARIGAYNESEIRNVPSQELAKHFTKKDNEYVLSEKIKKMVQFKKHDLLLDPYEKNFHVVICRNVTIYFKNEAKNEVYRKINESMVKGGIFFTGATENIFDPASFGFKRLSTFLYEKI
ncbi:MAG: protein-glutamate O-methyltransferase CheR [Clostridiaceae bacterium]